MADYALGGSLLAAERNREEHPVCSEFLKTRMTQALETQDPTELHYLLAQSDDYHSYMWRHYKKLDRTT
ncbi:MAG: hypothetical protein MRJ92_13410 [Nitrospira sp.]|nr:hypothetical protein [Nitrospira sp.]